MHIPPDSMIDRTANFIFSKRDSPKPFLVMASSFYVHTPVKNRCRWLVEKYEPRLPVDARNRQQRLEYAAFIQTLDHHVVTILDAIDDSGQRDNTRVELYDLSVDIAEQRDLSHTFPDVAARLRDRLQQQLDAMNARRAVPRQTTLTDNQGLR
jgi:hypothetical protein